MFVNAKVPDNSFCISFLFSPSARLILAVLSPLYQTSARRCSTSLLWLRIDQRSVNLALRDYVTITGEPLLASRSTDCKPKHQGFTTPEESLGEPRILSLDAQLTGARRSFRPLLTRQPAKKICQSITFVVNSHWGEICHFLSIAGQQLCWRPTPRLLMHGGPYLRGISELAHGYTW